MALGDILVEVQGVAKHFGEGETRVDALRSVDDFQGPFPITLPDIGRKDEGHRQLDEDRLNEAGLLLGCPNHVSLVVRNKDL